MERELTSGNFWGWKFTALCERIFFFFNLILFFKLYIIVLVLPNISVGYIGDLCSIEHVILEKEGLLPVLFMNGPCSPASRVLPTSQRLAMGVLSADQGHPGHSVHPAWWFSTCQQPWLQGQNNSSIGQPSLDWSKSWSNDMRVKIQNNIQQQNKLHQPGFHTPGQLSRV